jgi:hypothetical protein
MELAPPAEGELEDYLRQFADGAEVRPPAIQLRRAAALPALTRFRREARRKLPPRAKIAARRTATAAATALRRNPGRGRILPDFLVAGVAKCGTTSLFDWICEHPFVARPVTNGKERKELLFFDYRYARGVDWYRAHFATERERDEFRDAQGRPFLTGEATATYLTNYRAPERVAEVIPRVKMIVTLRNPIDRAFSAYQMSRRERLEDCDSFEAALALEERRLAPELERTRRDPLYTPPPPAPLGYWSYLHRSRYAEHIERWFAFLPREQFLFLRFEDLTADPQRALDAVYEFLALPPHRHGEFARRNTGGYADLIAPETRRRLIAYFQPHNERLAELTGIDFGWDR